MDELTIATIKNETAKKIVSELMFKVEALSLEGIKPHKVFVGELNNEDQVKNIKFYSPMLWDTGIRQDKITETLVRIRKEYQSIVDNETQKYK